ncbi:MAG: cation diffusion facilitator family transporter [Anaerolineae bacterium]|nr:MAG: cation diffusion facilitator family transporter [Anaerolineae bacterium]
MNRPEEQHDYGHQGEHSGHGHVHGVVDPVLATSDRGIWAIKWSFAGLMVTALLQVGVVYFTGSVALLADTVHNFGDALTAVPLWIAFRMVRMKPSPRFTYGYGRVEDLAGVAIILTILVSAVIAGYESISRFLDPEPVRYLWAIVAASLIGFVGNELVALFRIRVGKEIHSAALIADGHHARVDGLTSLAVLASAVGVWLGFPLADPLVGLAITVVILRIVWQSGKLIFEHLLDGVDPAVVDEIRHAALHVKGIRNVSDVRARWLGHRMHAEVNLAVNPELSVVEAHELARGARHEIMRQLDYLSNTIIHVDPANASGESHHQLDGHAHDDLVSHSH